jgi:hypothetical protein
VAGDLLPSKPPPRFCIELPLEGVVHFRLDASSYEDERRLRVFLRGSRKMRRLPEFIDALLDDLDRKDEIAGRAA